MNNIDTKEWLNRIIAIAKINRKKADFSIK